MNCASDANVTLLDDISIEEFVDKYFTFFPKEPNSYYVEMHHSACMNCFISGCKKLFGEVKMPNEMTLEQFDLLRQNLIQFGYDTKFVKTETDIKVWFEPYISN
jgi:hypothetical protein